MRLSVDDGCQSDVRIADLCAKYEIECIFYWPVEWHSLAYSKGYSPLNYVDAFRISKQFEVGSHTITHRHLTEISQFDAVQEITGSQAMLRKMFNQPILKFAPPRGYTNVELTELTKQFYTEQRLTRGDGLVHIHPNSGANDYRPWREVLKEKTADGSRIECWGHSWEWDKYNMWAEIEDYFREYSRSNAE